MISILIIEDTEINYIVRRSNNSKNIYLRFGKDLSLNIILPKRSRSDPQKIINEKKSWIKNKYLELSNRKPIFRGTQILYNGIYHEFEEIISSDMSVNIVDNKILLSKTKDMNCKTLLRNWMTVKTKKFINEKSPQFIQKLGVKTPSIRVKKTARWGYCKKKGELTFNWQLTALPKDLAEYIVIHEITHLSEFNHSKNFKNKLKSLCPDYKNREKRLNEYYSNN